MSNMNVNTSINTNVAISPTDILVDNEKLSISPIIKALEAGFDWMNRRFYNGELARPVIVVSEGDKERAMGWFTYYKPWHLKDTEVTACELMVASDYLDRGFEHVVNTLAHEMIHCYNFAHEIKDCARSGSRHNKKFKQTAEEHGMHWVEPQDDDAKADYKRVGFARVALNDDVKDEVYEALTPLKEALILYRDKRKKGDKTAKGKGDKVGKAGVIKYQCGCCGNSVRATKEVRLICADCMVPMEPMN